MLNRWLLGFFHGDGLQKLKERLGEDRWEGLHEDGQTLFFHQLTGNLFNIDLIDESTLRRYDLSIARHWQTITAARNKREGHMGLLNMGQGEGSQIIQLFGRGVRLKGRGFSLKRTPKGELPKGLYLEKLETLNIFGVRADYMAKFKDYLREEGITPTDEILELDFPTRANLPAKSLKTLRLKDGYKDNQKNGFKRTHFPALYEVPAAFIDSESGRSKIKPPHVVVDLYPRIQALSSSEGRNAQKAKDARQTGKLSTGALRFFDWDRIFLTVQEHKLLSSWSNLKVDRERLKTFCLGDTSWYTLYVPASELAIRRLDDVRRQEDILIQLLTDFTERYYQALKAAYPKLPEYDLVKLYPKNEWLAICHLTDVNDSSAETQLKHFRTIMHELGEKNQTFGRRLFWVVRVGGGEGTDSHVHLHAMVGHHAVTNGHHYSYTTDEAVRFLKRKFKDHGIRVLEQYDPTDACGKFVDYGKFVHVGLVMPEMEYLSLLSRIDSASKREQPMSITISVVMPKARNSKSDGSDLKREPYLMVKDAIFECPARQGQKFGR